MNKLPVSSRWDDEVRLLAWLAVCVSVLSFLYHYRHGDVLLYGDAVAHINIARRVFDSKTPGLLQLGTVWLPLPHLLILPFVVSDSLWQSGAGGSLPSMVAYVMGVVGIFLLARGALQRAGAPDAATRVAAWSAALLYGANPNLLYMQSTAMGEALYLAFFIWAVLYFSEFARGDAKALAKCGWCLVAACLTRYDGWFLAIVMVVAAVIMIFRPFKVRDGDGSTSSIPELRKALVKFVLLAAAAPVFWLAYNAVVYRNPLEFANGRYSARAIEQETGTVNPSRGNMLAAASYFLKAAELNVGQQKWQGRLFLWLALLGGLVVWFGGRGRATVMLWTPLPFYAVAVAYGSVPIFVPGWWPFSDYNLRYGLQLLPAFAVFVPLGLLFLTRKAGSLLAAPKPTAQGGRWAGRAALAAILLLTAFSYVMIWRAGPACYREAAINSRYRIALDTQLADLLQQMPPRATVLMYLGDHVGALERAGIPLRRVINEGNHRVWKQPADPEGLWERALADPAAYADYIVASKGDPVWQAVAGDHLKELLEIHTSRQPRTIIYEGRAR